MASLHSPSTIEPAATSSRLNVADRLSHFAATMPAALAVACPRRRSPGYASRQSASGSEYAVTTFAELDADATRIARGLAAWGVPPGTRLALLVQPGIEFVTLVFAMLRAGTVIVLVDPGLGRRNLVRCLAEVEPEGFIAIPVAQAARLWFKRRFPRAKWNLTVGSRWFWGGMTLRKLRCLSGLKNSLTAPRSVVPATTADDRAAIIFTSGSTGPPKGVLYTHRMFDTQVTEIQSAYGIEPGGVDLACFPLFALFNSAMGVTTVLPEMDFSRPAKADARKLLTAANDWQVTQAFASPAVWRVVSDHCARTGERIPTLRKVFSCGAPVPAEVLRSTLKCVGDGAEMHTPYGATECLPVATIEAEEVLSETAQRTDAGAGVCVGRKFDSIDWRLIGITDEAIATIDDAPQLPAREVGELIVRGPQVSPRYVMRRDCNENAKVLERAGASSPPRITSLPHGGEDAPARLEVDDFAHQWHRTGDVGYFDEQERFWYCGRKSHRVETSAGTIYTESVEAIFNKHPAVRRSALVGVGPRANQKPVMILEVRWPLTAAEHRELPQILQSGSPAAPDGEIFVVDWPLPVDVRHNAKINREQLASWATRWLKAGTPKRSGSPQPQAPSP